MFCEGDQKRLVYLFFFKTKKQINKTQNEKQARTQQKIEETV